MSLRPLVILPDSRLRLVSMPIATVDASVRDLAYDMLETMYAAPGIGLAAIQIGEPVRLVTVDLANEGDERKALVLVNPEIVWRSEELSVYEEGCLSIPEYYEEVERPAQVTVRFVDINGADAEMKADGLLAVCLQHEIDHLNGVLFIDHISRLKRARVIKKFAKAARDKVREADPSPADHAKA